MLAFHEAVAAWAKVSIKEVLDAIKDKKCKFEQLRNPTNLFDDIGRGKNIKNFHEVQSFASGIDYEMIQKVCRSEQVPSFNKFWDRLTIEP